MIKVYDGQDYSEIGNNLLNPNRPYCIPVLTRGFIKANGSNANGITRDCRIDDSAYVTIANQNHLDVYISGIVRINWSGDEDSWAYSEFYLLIANLQIGQTVEFDMTYSSPKHVRSCSWTNITMTESTSNGVVHFIGTATDSYIRMKINHSNYSWNPYSDSGDKAYHYAVTMTITNVTVDGKAIPFLANNIYDGTALIM